MLKWYYLPWIILNYRESANPVTNNATIIPSVTHFKSPKTSSGQIEPMLLSDDSLNINASFIPLDQEEEKNNEILKRNEETKVKKTYLLLCLLT